MPPNSRYPLPYSPWLNNDQKNYQFQSSILVMKGPLDVPRVCPTSLLFIVLAQLDPNSFALYVLPQHKSVNHTIPRWIPRDVAWIWTNDLNSSMGQSTLKYQRSIGQRNTSRC